MSAISGLSLEQALADREHWGHLVESSVGAHLANAAARGQCEVFYWRDKNREVDFVLRSGRAVVAVEVKSGRERNARPGLAAFSEIWNPQRTLLVGGDGIAIDEFLETPVEEWIGA